MGEKKIEFTRFGNFRIITILCLLRKEGKLPALHKNGVRNDDKQNNPACAGQHSQKCSSRSTPFSMTFINYDLEASRISPINQRLELQSEQSVTKSPKKTQLSNICSIGTHHCLYMSSPSHINVIEDNALCYTLHNFDVFVY